MTGKGSSDDVRARVDAALLRATRAGMAAETHEAGTRTGSQVMRELHETMARLHRQAEVRHQTAAALQLAHAEQLSAWERMRGASPRGRPGLLACVGEVLGAESVIVLGGTSDGPAAIAASGGTATAAAELELALGEGPVHDCAADGRAVSAADPARRWPRFGEAIADLGIGTVGASPLAAGGARIGVLVAFGLDDAGSGRVPVNLAAVATAVTETLLTPGLRIRDIALPCADDIAAVLHCASGIVAQTFGCSPEQAIRMIAAGAVESGQTVEGVARGIVDAHPAEPGQEPWESWLRP